MKFLRTALAHPKRTLNDALTLKPGQDWGAVAQLRCEHCMCAVDTEGQDWGRCPKCYGTDEVTEPTEFPPFFVTNRRRVPVANRPKWA